MRYYTHYYGGDMDVKPASPRGWRVFPSVTIKPGGDGMATDVTFRYRPQGAVLAAFHRSTAFARFVMGPLGSGKSTAAVAEIYRRACAQAPTADGVRRSRWVVVRNTYPDLETTTIKTWRAIFDDRFGPFGLGHPPRHRIRVALADRTRLEAEVIFIALDREDHVRKLRGLEATGFWLNEVKEIPKSVLDMATARVGRYPGPMQGGCSWSGIIGDTNPPDDEHWYYRLAEIERPDGFEFFRQPGAVKREDGRWAPHPLAENIVNLPANYYARQLAGKSDEWVRVYLAAEYGTVPDGRAVYPDYVDSLHCRAVAPDPARPIYVGADFGLTPAAVFGQVSASGQVRWIDELVTEDMGAVRFAEVLSAKLNRDYPQFSLARAVGDPSGDSRAQTDERTVFDILRAAGLPFEPAATNDLALRLDAVAAPLRRLVDGEAGLVLDPRCRTLRKGMMGGYRYRRLSLPGERFCETPDKNGFSHVCDAAQYLNLGLGQGDLLLRRRPRRVMTLRGDADYDVLRH